MCFECLQRRIYAEFAGKLAFSYGISNSGLPFGSSAVVQFTKSTLFKDADPSKSEDSIKRNCSSCGTRKQAPQLLLDNIPTLDGVSSNLSVLLFRKFSDEYCSEDLGSHKIGKANTDFPASKQDQAEVSIEVPSRRTSLLETKSNASQSFFNGGTKTPLAGLECACSTCNSCGRFSYSRIITALAPVSNVGISSCSLFEELALNFVSGFVEDHILCSLKLLIEGKATGRDGINFLRLIGILSFEENSFPGCVRHPNIMPILGMLKSSGHINLVLPRAPYTLENILYYSPNALRSDWHLSFLIYQLLSALAYMHGFGVAHGNICPSSVLLTDSSWCWLRLGEGETPPVISNLSSRSKESAFPRVGCCIDGSHSLGLYADLKLSQSVNWHNCFRRWWMGELDFSVKPDESNDEGWRELSKSKWRLAKGDEQLDFTYSTSEIPHHVSDECLSELAVCSYKARRLPLSVLRVADRSVYEPNEYPSTMQRLYQWTPDECIPDFYFDPQIFCSLLPGMSDLTVPSWAGSAEEFIRLHRDALESDRVSCQIHHWIDITFGYKMSGEAAVAAKNVMLPASASTLPSEGEKAFLLETAHLKELEEAAAFCEHAWHLSPIYSCHLLKDDSSVEDFSSKSLADTNRTTDHGIPHGAQLMVDLKYLLKNMEVDEDSSVGYQELLCWKQKSFSSRNVSEDVANDVFLVGCIIAELHLRRPLFDPTSFTTYLESGVFPRLMLELPSHVEVFVEACIRTDWRRRPSAKCLLESPYFTTTVKSPSLFLAPLHLLSKNGSRLHYAANFAKQGALKAMGTFAAEMCAPYCLPLVATLLSDAEAEWAYIMLKEFLKCLNPRAIKTLVLPAIQKILQASYSHLKVSLLQDSFVQEVWKGIGKQSYLEKIHPMVLSNLQVAPHKSSAASAASVLLIGSSEELGLPITVHQTILPLILCFGRGLSSDGLDVVVRIGGLFGESFVVKQLLPLLRNVVRSCIDGSVNKTEPVQSWSALALTDCLLTLNGLAAVLPKVVVVKELIEVAASSLIGICQQIGPDLTALHVLPKLKELFDELAFSQETSNSFGFLGESFNMSRKSEEDQIKSRMDLVFFYGAIIGKYKPFLLRFQLQVPSVACPSVSDYVLEVINSCILLFESVIFQCKYSGESSRSFPENRRARRISFSKNSPEHGPPKILLNSVGWSIPQSQGNRGAKNLNANKRVQDYSQNEIETGVTSSNFGMHETWYWFPSPASNWDGPDFLGRCGGAKDELPWKIRASVVHSVRAHQGALRSFALCQDECTVFTAGVGPGFKGTVQKWELSTMSATSGYHGHEEVVNDISVLASSGRVASCDGTVHVWNSQTGELLSIYAEFSGCYAYLSSPLASASRLNPDQGNMLNFNPPSSGILTTAFDGNLYTCMHHLEYVDKLVVGTGGGSLRFIDVNKGQKLHMWRSESAEPSYPSLISSICSCGSDKLQADGAVGSPSWIAAGLSSGNCKLLDMRSGNIIASWQAHDGYVTKLAAPEDHLLVSASLDRTLRVWDLRMNWASKPVVFRGHNDSVSGFSVWRQDVISISRNKIGLSSLSKSADGISKTSNLQYQITHHHKDGQHRITPQYLYMTDRESRNMSVLSSVVILPFSRLFLVGTEDGYLKILDLFHILLRLMDLRPQCKLFYDLRTSLCAWVEVDYEVPLDTILGAYYLRGLCNMVSQEELPALAIFTSPIVLDEVYCTVGDLPANAHDALLIFRFVAESSFMQC
ncbi:hypothetical protein RJ639_043837 [Escallonia herrerae]|uniref:BEACH domain-containing protein n=1 Tax=Escallonia herrerae TaxID=1293975 RepID=A0AA88WHA1_9ASTE|nr:hypothetical protein RJ639_043837 [Escallonia herrerae]